MKGIARQAAGLRWPLRDGQSVYGKAVESGQFPADWQTEQWNVGALIWRDRPEQRHPQLGVASAHLAGMPGQENKKTGDPDGNVPGKCATSLLSAGAGYRPSWEQASYRPGTQVVQAESQGIKKNASMTWHHTGVA
jgi:hypothetical protein